MEFLISPYLNGLHIYVERKVEVALLGNVNQSLLKHLDNSKSKKFHQYYFKTLANREYFITEKAFFKEFRPKYSLQGIDNDFLDSIEGRKGEILEYLDKGEIARLYFEIFYKARIKSGDKVKEKDLASFFTKLVHTLKPHEYCALDNPIRKYFDLKKESFFVGFILISSAYKKWAAKHAQRINTIRQEFMNNDLESFFDHSRITDMKLMDLIFWAKANKPNSDIP